jgi:hypothetical protein
MTIAEPLPGMLRETRRDRHGESPMRTEAVWGFEHCRWLCHFENEHLLSEATPQDLAAPTDLPSERL